MRLSTGVGEAVIRGMANRADNERGFVGVDAHYDEGEGEHRIGIDLGVGEILVRQE